ncbi:MAG: hypothetical protein OSB44_00050 [Verrucomicrobiales bacterium]|nr:hypothetical protein [Verrucomicrobiales bacterium]
MSQQNTEKMRCITGIYPVCNIVRYPGIKRACSAYELNAGQIETELDIHNPIDWKIIQDNPSLQPSQQ